MRDLKWFLMVADKSLGKPSIVRAMFTPLAAFAISIATHLPMATLFDDFYFCFALLDLLDARLILKYH